MRIAAAARPFVSSPKRKGKGKFQPRTGHEDPEEE